MFNYILYLYIYIYIYIYILLYIFLKVIVNNMRDVFGAFYTTN